MNDALLALADHDAAVVRARHDVEHPPAQAAVNAANEQLAALANDKRALDELRTPLTKRAAVLESDATAARERAAVIQRRLDAATGAGRDLEAMEEERRSLETRASGFEDDQLEALEALEPLDAADEELRERAAAIAEERDAAAARLEDELAAATAALAELVEQRAAIAAALDPALLARYEAVAARTGGSGAARLVDGRCGGCRVAVPASVADRLLHGADHDAIATCDECGRLLVR